jgi:hypothetical protein
MIVRVWCVLSVAFVAGCSSHPGTESGSSPASGSEPDAAIKDAALDVVEAASGTSVEQGVMVDYESLFPVKGLTVTDNGQTATTDANGNWSLQPTVTSSTYSRLLFPDSTAVSADIDFSTVVIPDLSTYSLEESVLGNDTTKALVHIVVVTQPSCASAVGGTLSVTSPSGARVEYFGTASTPDEQVTSFQAVAAGRPVAVIFNIDPSATLSFQISHPTCTQVPFPVTYGGRQYPGTVRLSPGEPGAVNSALVVVLE